MPESKGPSLLRNTAMLNTQGWCISGPTRADVINMLTYSSVPDAYHVLNFHSVFLRVRNLKMEHQVGLRGITNPEVFAFHVCSSSRALTFISHILVAF